MLSLNICIFFISCNGDNADVSIIGLWVSSNNSNTYNTDNVNVFLFNPDSTMGDLGHSPGHWMIKGDTITIVHLKQNYYDNVIDTVKYNFNYISFDSLEFYKRDVKQTVISDPYSSENKSTILKVVTIDTIRVTRAKKLDIPFNEAIVGKWKSFQDKTLNIYREGKIHAPFLKPSDKERHNYESFRWSAQWSNTYYSNSARYTINTDSSLTITFTGTTTRKEKYSLSRGIGYNPTETRVMSKSNISTVKNLKIKNVFNNYLMTDKGDFRKIMSNK